jgi:hypothetical protein
MYTFLSDCPGNIQSEKARGYLMMKLLEKGEISHRSSPSFKPKIEFHQYA